VDTETLNKIATSLEQKFQTQLDSFNADISKQLHELSTQLTKGIESKYEIVDKELLDYKNVKMKNIDDALHNILQEVSLAVLGKTMSFKDNEDYIEQILKEKFIQMR
jgi:flagellar biosynthesis/type III secretory pathway protein FliH